MDKGASPTASGTTQVEPVPVSPLRASVPNAGDDPLLVDGKLFQPASYDGKPRHLSRQHKDMFASFVEPIWERLETMPNDELWGVIEACRSVSPINCAWSDYAMAKILHDVAVWDLSNRLAAQAIEARRAETGTGSVHESAVAEGHAPKGDHP